METIDHLLCKIFCGDCLPFMRSLHDKCVDLVLTDLTSIYTGCII